jgi:hypothetical protein
LAGAQELQVLGCGGLPAHFSFYVFNIDEFHIALFLRLSYFFALRRAYYQQQIVKEL